MIMKFEITLEVEDQENAPTQLEYKEEFEQWLGHRNPYDFRNYIIDAHVIAKRFRLKNWQRRNGAKLA